jgi:hypothetical protein
VPRGSFLWTEAVFSVFHARQIEAFYLHTIDDATLADLEAALTLYFEL